MTYTQTRAFVVANASTDKYWCLQNVRRGYGIPAYYSTARKAWNGTQQHQDRNFPAGCAVPVFWSLNLTLDGVYADYGHIAVRLADGRIWTDGRYYANVDTLNAGYLGGKGVYLGWGESVNNVKVVTQEVSMAETISDDVSRQIGFHFLGRNGKDGKPNALNSRQGDLYGKPLTNAQLSTFFLSAESREWRDSRLPKVYAERDALKDTNANLTTVNTQLTKAVEDKNGTINIQKGTIIGLQNTVDEKQAEIDVLIDENAKLRKQLEDCGTTPDPDSIVISKSWWDNAFEKIKAFFK